VLAPYKILLSLKKGRIEVLRLRLLFCVIACATISMIWHEVCSAKSDVSNLARGTFLVILIVDDSRELCDALAAFLEVEGHSVECAANGEEGLRWLTRSSIRPSLVFLDVVMPVLDGWGFLAGIRKNPQIAGVPVVMMSGGSDVSEQAKELGAAAVVRKPVAPETFHRIIDHFAAT
jgi:CheY-like chemotaxis protein